MKVPDINLEFVTNYANPHAWLLSADNLHEQALSIYTKRDGALLILRRANGATKKWERVNKSVFLLCGLALENAIKAFLVYENPQWISNGKLARNLRSHRLTSLQAKSKLIPLKKRSQLVLRRFEDGIDSWARYPCGLSVEASRDEASIERRLWSEYLYLMRAYGKRLQVLLSKELWRGPHGFEGRWTFQGDYLSS